MTTVVEFYIGDKLRKKSTISLQQYFNKSNSKKIELGCYDYCEQYCRSNGTDLTLAISIYSDTINNLLYNLEQDRPTIKKLSKEISKERYNPYNLAFLKPHELDEDNWMKIILRKNTTEYKLNNLPTIESKPCYRCKKTEYFYRQIQTRSADEPMTTYYTCKNCGKTFSVNN